MVKYQKLGCKKCAHYEAFHKYPNQNAVARHYCKKCNDEISYRLVQGFEYDIDLYIVWLPKRCYFQNLFEESEEAKREREERFIAYNNSFADQVD